MRMELESQTKALGELDPTESPIEIIKVAGYNDMAHVSVLLDSLASNRAELSAIENAYTPQHPTYQTAKAAIEGMTRGLARELGPKNIRVNTIIPGNVKTPRQMKWYSPEGEQEIVDAQCLKGRLEPVDIAAMALFLASDDARLCTAHNYWVDAGWR